MSSARISVLMHDDVVFGIRVAVLLGCVPVYAWCWWVSLHGPGGRR